MKNLFLKSFLIPCFRNKANLHNIKCKNTIYIGSYNIYLQFIDCILGSVLYFSSGFKYLEVLPGVLVIQTNKLNYEEFDYLRVIITI